MIESTITFRSWTDEKNKIRAIKFLRELAPLVGGEGARLGLRDAKDLIERLGRGEIEIVVAVDPLYRGFVLQAARAVGIEEWQSEIRTVYLADMVEPRLPVEPEDFYPEEDYSYSDDVPF